MYGVGLATKLDVELDLELDDDVDDNVDVGLGVDVDVGLVVGVVEASECEIVLTSSSPELFSMIIPSVPPGTGRILPPTATAPPTPTPTTIHPTCALAVWPPLTVNVLEALTSVGAPVEFWVIVELAVDAGGGDDFGVSVDVGKDPLELSDFGFWSLVVPIVRVGLTDVFGLAVGIVGSPVGAIGGVFWLFIGEHIGLRLLCLR